MKKAIVLAMLLMAGIAVFGQTLTVLSVGPTKIGNTTDFAYAEEQLKKDFPNVKVKVLQIDLSDGSSLTMDAMLAAGNVPNIYYDSMVRASKYMVDGFALPLNGIFKDLDKWDATTLKMYTKNGNVLGLPGLGSAQGMCINLDIMDEIGYKVPDNWTVDDFLKMAELVKQKYKGKKWATGMFAANQSGDYLINGWYATFGVKWYENGDYDTALVAKNGGEKVYAFYQTLVKNEYVPPNAATLCDDDYVMQWASGQLAATAFFPNWMASYWESAIKQGIITKPFRVKYVPFPRATGVDKVPTYFNGNVAVIHKTGTDIDKVAVKFLEYLYSPKVFETATKEIGVYSARTDVATKPQLAETQQVIDIIAKNGLQDVGLTDSRFVERRAMQFPILQQVLTFKLTPKEAIEKFEKALSSVKK